MSDKQHVRIEPANALFTKSGGNKRGGLVTLSGAGGLAPQALIRLVTGDPDTPVVVGCQIGARPQNLAFRGMRAVADLRWGWESSGPIRATIDLERGAAFAVVGSYLEVDCRFDADTANTQPMVISGTAAQGSVGASGKSKLTRTISSINPPQANVAPAGVFAVSVPDFAKTVRVSRVPIAQPVRVDFLNSLQTLDSFTIPALATMADEVLIPNGTDIISVTNTGAADLTSVVLVFGLCIG